MLSCVVGKQNINTIDYPEKQLREWAKRKLLKCPVCGENLLYRHGLIKIPHFAHGKDSECIYTFYENETKCHALGKVLLYKWLKQLDNIKNLELESYIKETKQRPDLYFELNDKRYIIEYQCTPITLEEYLERKELYKLNGIIDIWILGTENFNFNPSGKIKMKVLDSALFYEKKLYYFNPFEEMIYYAESSFKYVDGFYNIKKYNVNDYNIVFNEIINEHCNTKLFDYVDYINKVNKQELEKFLNEKNSIYDKFVLELKDEEIKIKKENDKIKRLIKDKNIFLYDNLRKIMTIKGWQKIDFISYKGSMKINRWFLNDLYNTYTEKFSENEIHIVLCHWNFKINEIRNFLINSFSGANVIFADGAGD